MKHVLLTFVFCLSLNANASLIFNNGFDVNAVQASTKTSTSTNEYALWDDFSLSQHSTIDALSFLMNGDSNFGPTTIEIRSDNAGTLGASVFRASLGSLDINRTSPGGFFSQFDVNLPGLSLDAGDYWISFTNITFQGTALGSFGANEMIQSVNASVVPAFARGNFEVVGEYIPFQLLGTAKPVSEPPLAALFSIVVLLFVRRRIVA